MPFLYELRCAIITCRILYGATYDDIERKTGVARDTARKIATRAIERAGCENIHEVLACVGDLDRSGRIPRVADVTELSKTIRNAILENPELKPHEAVIDKENIVIPGLPEGNGLHDLSSRMYNTIILTSRTDTRSQTLYASMKYQNPS